MLLSMAQINSIKAFSLDAGVDIERQPFDEYVLVRRYGAQDSVRVYRDGAINLTEDPRYWVIDNPEKGEPNLPHPDSCQDGDGPYVLPIVDEEYGGVIAWANTPENAVRIVDALSKVQS